ncbi:MAG: hypothetical protein D6743_05340 [Calditrichaeota bacterium]|nr:MAG: hypothetical protein D6743_05340 [Calditrichota bacterium]
MRVLLIATYELGHQPLNLASPAAHLAQAGCDVSCLDLSVQPFDDTLAGEAHLVAFSTPMHTALQLALRAAERVRKLNPRCHICFYGLYAGLHAQQLLRRGIDFVVGGEFERGLAQLAHALQNGGPVPAEGVISHTHAGGVFLGRQSFLLPKRDLLPPLERYAHLLNDSRQSQVGYVEASRGCAHRCLHCPITPVYRGKLRLVPREVVLADIEQLVESGAEHITFGDPDFLNAVKHSAAVVDEMHRRHPALTFDFTAKI